MKKIKIISVLLFISVLFSCDRHTLCNIGYWEIDSIYQFGAIKLENPVSCDNNLINNNYLNSNDTCSSNLFAIKANFLSKYISGDPENCKGYVMQDSIVNIEIRSSNDFNEEYKQGQLLNDIFKVKINNDMPESENCPVALNEFLNKKEPCPDILFFYLSELPDSIRLHEFSINISVNDTMFTSKTLSIYITP